MTTLLILFSIIVGLVLLWLTTIFVTSLVEKSEVYELAALPVGPSAGNAADTSPEQGPIPLNYEREQNYLTTAMTRAAQLGYTHGGEFCIRKYPGVRVSLWMSSDRTTIAQIGFGSLLKLPVKRTRLLSRLTTGRVLATQNESGLVDFTNMESRQVIMDADFDALHARHAAWLAAADKEGLVRPFARSPFDDLQLIEAERAARLEAFGYVRFLDPLRCTYRFTLKGAAMNSTVGIWRGLRESRKGMKR